MRTLFITSICVHYNEWITGTRFRHHTMKTYKSYYVVRRKNTSKFIFFMSSLVFSTKNFTIVLLEIPAISIKIQLYNDFFVKKNFCKEKNLFILTFLVHILYPCLLTCLQDQIEVNF